MKFFEVQAMCGHVGKSSYIPIRFAVMAEDAKEAAAKVMGLCAGKASP